MNPQIKPHQIALWIGFWLSVAAYQERITGSWDTIEGWSWHCRLMALSYSLFVWALHRLETNPLTRFSVNVIQGACIANIYDEFFGDPVNGGWLELVIFFSILIISLILFIRKQPKYHLWLRKFTKS